MFTKRHHIQLAKFFHNNKPKIKSESGIIFDTADLDKTIYWDGLVEELSTFLSNDNKRFNADKFRKACSGK